MLSDEVVFSMFRASVLGEEENNQDAEIKEDLGAGIADNEANEEREQDKKSQRVRFLFQQMRMIPTGTRDMYGNMMRNYPSSPVYLMMGLGAIATNIARWSAIKRLSGHINNTIRTGCFYKFIAPSRFGKGIVMSFIADLGDHVEEIRRCEHEKWVKQQRVLVNNNDADAMAKVKLRTQCQRPSRVFLTGANVLQTQYTAATNAGCGMILVNEIKNGKSRYTNLDGSYGSLLTFYDKPVLGRTFRQAQAIPAMKNCRMQLIAAGVLDDWVSFIERSGRNSGMLARVVPILGYDHKFARLSFERLVEYDFPLNDLKKVLGIMELLFQSHDVADAQPPLKLQFCASTLDLNYKQTNELLITHFKAQPVTDWLGIFNTLADSEPPSTEELMTEGTGTGIITVYLEQTIATYSEKATTSGDKLFLRGLKDNLLRIAFDYYWADFIVGYLDVEGKLTLDKETALRIELTRILDVGVVTFPLKIIPPFLLLMNYIIEGVFILNKYASGSSLVEAQGAVAASGSRKRRGIVQRLAQGYGRAKKRRFYISMLGKSFADINTEEMEQQLRILRSQGLITAPTHRSVSLERNLGPNAVQFLRESCDFADDDIATLLAANTNLTD